MQPHKLTGLLRPKDQLRSECGRSSRSWCIQSRLCMNAEAGFSEERCSVILCPCSPKYDCKCSCKINSCIFYDLTLDPITFNRPSRALVPLIAFLRSYGLRSPTRDARWVTSRMKYDRKCSSIRMLFMKKCYRSRLW